MANRPRRLIPRGEWLVLGAIYALAFGLRLYGLDWGLPGHGHMLMLERGSEAVGARIADWLESVGRRGTGAS